MRLTSEQLVDLANKCLEHDFPLTQRDPEIVQALTYEASKHAPGSIRKATLACMLVMYNNPSNLSAPALRQKIARGLAWL